MDLIHLNNAVNTTKAVRAFGGYHITLMGAIPVTVDICGVTFKHLLYFVNADVSSLLGYDLMTAAQPYPRCTQRHSVVTAV